jgi:hypothetical protein
LTGIENVLAQLASKLGNLDIHSSPPEQSNRSLSDQTSSARSPASGVGAATPAPFEGETAINSQSDYAREMLAQVVGTTPSIGQNAELKFALSALGELVSKKNQVSTSPATGGNTLVSRSLVETDAGKLEHPPWEIIKGAIDRARSEALL